MPSPPHSDNLDCHELFHGSGGYRSVKVVLAQDTVVRLRIEKRVQCKLSEDIEDGNIIYFESNSNIVPPKTVYVADAIDVVSKGHITAQIINPTQEPVT